MMRCQSKQKTALAIFARRGAPQASDDVDLTVVEFGGEVFRTEPLAWREWAAVIGCTSLLAIGGEAVRALRRKR